MQTVSVGVPRGIIRSGVTLVDLVALPLLALAFCVVLVPACAVVAAAAGGVNFVLGLRSLDFFPVFPVAARLLCGLSLLAFAALMAGAAVLLWQLFRTTWTRYAAWHRSAWQGSPAALPNVVAAPGMTAGMGGTIRFTGMSALVFGVIFTVSFVVMMILAGGPFWHAWRWFT